MRGPGGGGFGTVLAVSGHLIDAPGRPVPRFPPEAEPGVTEELRRVLERWRVGAGDLALTAGARGADIIVAELCLARGAEVWLLLPLPDEEFLERSVRLPGTDWEERFCALRHRCRTLFQADELGRPADADDAFSRNDSWRLEVARREARGGHPRVLVVWDRTAGDGHVGTSHFVAQAERVGAEVEVVDPTRFIGVRS